MIGQLTKWVSNTFRHGSKAVSGIQELINWIKLHEWKDVTESIAVGTGKVWASWKACDLVAQVVTTAPVAVYKSGQSTAVTVKGLEKLLRYPNETNTFADLLHGTVMHLKLTGDSYWFKSEATLNGDRPLEIYLLNPCYIRVTLNGQNEVIGYTYTPENSRPMPLDIDEVIHFRRPHPNNDYYGLGDIEAGRELIGDCVNRLEWSKKFWKNGASPSGVMILDESVSNQEDWNKLKRAWHAEYGGKENAGKVAWLNGKWRYEQIGMSSADMQELERTKASTESIFQLHGVPLSVAGIRDAANYATASIDKELFGEFTVLPIVKIIEDTLNTDLVSGFGPNLELRFDRSFMTNAGRVAAEMTPLFDRGAISLNELRVKAGFARIEDNPLFDQHFINAGLVPLDLSGIADLGQTQQQAQRAIDRATARLLEPQS